ncbi:hypothetical protein F383_28263 [Gossypium arboreum]|uniref:Uncharacterized protein n=1 Tax=Gossypium arboreum TaxID=29729 RepID=A0A0B0P958_GOSAR|nr:hypothetical protein F383_28263 [Gossypium arboreum]
MKPILQINLISLK